jgi:hypothetical protein
MKTKFFRGFFILMATVMFAGTFFMSSCKKDDDTTPAVLVEDGFYIKGAGTALTDLNSKGLMKETRNEVLQTTRASLMEIYIAVKAGTQGFNIVSVAGTVQKTYGPGSGFANVTTGTTDEPKVTFQRGAYAESTTPFTVPTDGIYHVIIDTELGKVVIVPVQYWGLIGAATPGGWSNDTKINAGTFDLNTMTFETTNVTMLKGQFKFRYSGGWKVELDTVLDLGSGKKGVKVNTNFGGTMTALVPGGDNIDFATPGIYTAKAVWTLGSGWAMTLTKTGDVPTIDYTNYEMGIIGNAYYKTDGVTVAAWDENFGTQKPVVSGKIFTWTYTLNLIKDGEFKFRQGTDWAGKSIGYGDATWAGAAAANFSNNGGNIKVGADGNYTLVLKIDATTETYTITATKN